MGPDQFNTDHTIVSDKIPVPSGGGRDVHHRNIKDSVPAPDLGLGMKEIEKDLEIRVVLKIKSLSVQGLSSAPEVLIGIGGREIQEHNHVGQSWGKREDWSSRWPSCSGKLLHL